MPYPERVIPTSEPSQQVTASQLWASWLSPCTTATQEGYRADWEHFCGHLMRPVGEPTFEGAFAFLGLGKGRCVASVQEYFGRMLDNGYAPATVNRRIAAITSYARAAHDMDVIGWTLPKPPKARTQAYRDTKGPGLDTVASLISHLEASNDVKDVRMLAIVRLMFDLGLRRGEVYGLRYPEDLDFSGKRIRILRKGKRETEWRSCPESTWRTICAWCLRRGEQDRCTPSFAGLLFGRLQKSGWGWGKTAINSALEEACKRFGLPHIHPHALRHSSITALASDGSVSLRELLAHSGHSDPKVVVRYIDAVDDAASRMAEKVSATLEYRRADTPK